MTSDLLPAHAEIVAGEPVAPVRANPASRFSYWLERALVAASPRSYRNAFCTVAAVLVAFFALIVARGPVLQLRYGHDDMGFLSFAWRIRNGIFPNADYHIALGPLNSWIHAAGMWLLGPTAAVLPFCNGLVGVGIGWLAWTVAARRLPAVPAAIFAFTQAVVAMSPHLMRFEWYASTYDCYYNRQCFAVLGVVMLAAFLPLIRPDGRQGQRRDDRVLGATLGALLFLKINFFMAACGFLVLGAVTARQPRRLASRDLLAAFAVTALLCLPMIRFNVLAMFDDLRFAARVKAASPEAAITIHQVMDWLWDAIFEITLLAGAQLAARATLIFRRRDGHSSATAPSWLEFAAVVGMTVLLNITNAQGGTRSETPLLSSWLFVLAGYAIRNHGDTATQAKPFRQPGWTVAAMCVLAGWLWVHTFAPGLRCLCWSTWPWPTAWVQKTVAKTQPFDSASLASLRIAGDGGEAPQPLPYAAKVNDGLGMLRRLGGVHRVGALDFNDPFPFALLWPPPRGDFWTWGYDTGFSVAVHPTPTEAFGDADVMMVPKYAGHNAKCQQALETLYKTYIQENFRLTMESDQWSLYVRQ